MFGNRHRWSMSIGAALAGMRPVAEMQFADFVFCAMDQVVNQAAKLRMMFGGQARVPIVIRAPQERPDAQPSTSVRRSIFHAHAGAEGGVAQRPVLLPVVCLPPPFATTIQCCFSSTNCSTEVRRQEKRPNAYGFTESP